MWAAQPALDFACSLDLSASDQDGASLHTAPGTTPTLPPPRCSASLQHRLGRREQPSSHIHLTQVHHLARFILSWPSSHNESRISAGDTVSFFFFLKYHNLNYLFLSLTCNSKSTEMGHWHSKSDFPCQLQSRSELTTSGLLVSGVVTTRHAPK